MHLVWVTGFERGAKLWPFDGSLADLAGGAQVVITETYPAEAYSHVGITLSAGMTKQRQDHRPQALEQIPTWPTNNRVLFSKELMDQIEDGFGSSKTAEDPFDALAGLLGMIEVVDGRRAEGAHSTESNSPVEGWILGQTSSRRVPKVAPVPTN